MFTIPLKNRMKYFLKINFIHILLGNPKLLGVYHILSIEYCVIGRALGETSGGTSVTEEKSSSFLQSNTRTHSHTAQKYVKDKNVK